MHEPQGTVELEIFACYGCPPNILFFRTNNYYELVRNVNG